MNGEKQRKPVDPVIQHLQARADGFGQRVKQFVEGSRANKAKSPEKAAAKRPGMLDRILKALGLKKA